MSYYLLYYKFWYNNKINYHTFSYIYWKNEIIELIRFCSDLHKTPELLEKQNLRKDTHAIDFHWFRVVPLYFSQSYN